MATKGSSHRRTLRIAFVGALWLTGCSDAGERCRGQLVEHWRGADFGPGGDWEVVRTCPQEEACLELDVESDNFRNHAFCATSRTHAAECRGTTGRICSDEHHLFTCVNGFRVTPGDAKVWPETCADDTPSCFEPEPGRAFCVKDRTPAAICDGHAARSIEFCAVSHAACSHANVAQFCLDAQSSVMCFGGVPIQTAQCDLPGTTSGHCVEITSIEVSPCDYTSH